MTIREITLAVAPVRAAPVLTAFSALLVTLSCQSSEAATVVSSVQYQKALVLECFGDTCGADFAAPGDKRRLNVTRITCALFASAGSAFGYGSANLKNASNSVVLAQYLPGVFSAPNGVHTINQAVDFQVSATRYISVGMNVATGSVGSGECTATGTLDTLQ